MANLPKKTSQRAVGVSPKASASGRSPAGSSNASSSRLRPSVKVPKAAPPPEPEPEPEEVQEVAEEVQEVQEAAEPEGDSLLGELDEAVVAVPKREGMPLKADEHLLSDDSLYGDDDPLEKAKQAKLLKKPMAPVAKASTRVPAAGSQKKAKAAESSGTAEAVEDAPKAGTSSKKLKPGSDSRVMKPAQLEETVDVPPLEDDAEPVEDTKTTRRMSGKGTSRMMKGGSRRGEKPAEAEDDTSSRVSRRATKRSMRDKAAGGGGFKLTKLQKAGLIAGFVVVLVVVAGYSPFMKWMYTKSITGPDVALESRKSAAKSLVEFDSGAGYEVCGQAMLNPDDKIREAGVYGMGVLGKARNTRGLAITSFSNTLGAAEPATKAQIIQAMGEIAQATNKAAEADKEAKSEERLKDDNNDLNTLATAIMPHADAGTEPAAEVRAAAVENLKNLRVPGVCKQLIKIATSGDANLKEPARNGIASTALPDAAGALLEAVGGPDKALSGVCKAAFEFVRDSAKSETLAALVSDPSDDVRIEVVKALAKRGNDAQAAAGLVHAFKDKLPEVRATAVKGITTTGMAGSVQTIADLVNDSDENVRVETANTLGELRDPESAKLVLEAFKNPMSGKTMSAFVTALGKRTSGKDLKACAIVMNILERNPSTADSAKEAMALLTQSKAGSSRINERRGWSVEKWKAWWANISEREKMRKGALDSIEALKKHKDDDHLTFPKLMHQTEEQLDILEKCKEMCNPDDPEDIPLLDDQEHQGSFLKEHFQKNASIDMRN